MCEPYNSDYLNYIIPMDIIPYFSKLCISFDVSSLILVTFSRTCLFVFIYYILNMYIKQQNTFFSWLFWILLLVIFLNYFSLLIAISKTPKYKNRTDTKEVVLMK